MTAYAEFLRQKIRLAQFNGFDVPVAQINPHLKPHTRDIVRWAVQGGQRAIFASFGLHKTATQLEIFRLIGHARPELLRLQVAPLGVRQEFRAEIDARFQGEFAIDMRFVRRDSEIDDPATLYLTNYEAVREGNITVPRFGATSLDEASVLRSYGSKTYQEFLPAFEPVEFKFVATATPSPNRYKELIHYAGYLGVMDTGQALTRFFQRDSEKAGNLTLYPHKEEEFWLWVASWAVFIQRPSDLGHSDDGYVLPELDVRYHKPQSDRGRGYADKPVVKSKAEYSLARWQVDAHAFWRSSGNRMLTAEEMASYGPAKLAKLFTEESLANVYDFDFHVKIGEELLARQALPSTFMSLAPGSHHSEVWHDVVRMLTLNGEQSNRAVEKHVCPLQFDIVDRLIERYSMKGERVYDPFCGLGTVPVRAIKLGRTGGGSELNPAYFLDQVHYLRAAEREASMPSLFDFEAVAEVETAA